MLQKRRGNRFVMNKLLLRRGQKLDEAKQIGSRIQAENLLYDAL
jgi:hypothetical protein